MSVNFLLCVLLSAICQADSAPEKPKRSALNQLTRTLLRRYDCGVRPVLNWTSPTVVFIDLIIQSVLEVDGQTQKVTTSIWYRQIWKDEFLVWDPEEFDGITEISLSSDAIWVPDIIISEFVDEGRSPAIPYVYVNSSGTVKNYKPIQVVSACDLEIYAFPFDKQNCTLTFRSWLHSVSEVDLALWRTAEDIANDTREFMNDGEWELLSVPSHYWKLNLADRDYAHIQFNVLIRRRPLLYVVSLLIPSIFLMVVDVISFYLPPNSGTRITFKTSILLGYTVFRVNLMDEIPATAIKTPLIGIFFAVCMALLVLSLAKSIFIVKLLHHSEKEVKEMSISACLLDKYGSTDQTFSESLFTSVRTLDDIDHSGGYEFDLSPETDLLSLTEAPDSVPQLEKVLQEMVSLRLHLQEEENDGVAQAEWLALCYKVDKFLFRIYLLILLVYSSTLLLLWSSWSSA
ncbi:5-hydroxytryptamine receptor 3B [Electrophorus electricus]|uniref:5-hydroxytryptamine receptor 3B n=1 Tax=Electrophorus electricus TaxID=8005 RepID=UPI0015D01498|nr:5-hydroxytryptamine receptor 3B [Electrophorus electricus]